MLREKKYRIKIKYAKILRNRGTSSVLQARNKDTG